ncbi:TVG0696965 [Thermoplasma volcanium GSS1]|uniref:TVG0696965 protein n=1 Tax=Thermoplasma volcanium (strain ATCC 51530 / DSM 4299 / JCM 9571 / NBRC 15438 / GSS1) TaxID=273116 RepID=Q97AX0_THEVO|nr:TVG0696965 [Thermoplasma volcanium GSS1]
MKKNASYKIIKEETSNSKIIEFNNGLILRLVTLDIDNKKRELVRTIYYLDSYQLEYIEIEKYKLEYNG